MSKLFKTLLAVLTTSLTLSSAFAYNPQGALTVSLAAGYDYFAAKREMQNTGVPLIMLAYNLRPNWAFEIMAGMFTTYYNSSVHNSSRIDGSLFSVDALYRFSPYKFIQPYVLAGVGAMGLNPNRNDAHNEGNVNAGVGTQLFIGDLVAFRFEARDFYTITGGKNDVMLIGGLSFLFNLC